LQHPNLNVWRRDVLALESIAAALAGQRAVLSSLGVPFSRNAIDVYSRGTANLMQAMQRHAIRRLVCVSSSAAEPHAAGEGGFVFNRIVQPLIVNTLGKTLYADMRRMEALLRASDLARTIVRPSGLFETQVYLQNDPARLRHLGV
jgi:nucleoside-diphosphate-sugar epimerase